MSARIPLGQVWEDCAAFLRAELSLVMPVALAGFGVPLVAAMLAVPADQARAGALVPGLWMLWLLPAGLLAMTGSLAISALALRPGASVRDCIGVALSRVPAGIGLFGLNLALQIVLAVPLALARTLDGGAGAASLVANLAVFALMIWLFVRVLPIWALLAVENVTAVRAVRRSFAVTAGHYRKLLLVRLVGAVAGVVALVVLLVPVGVVFRLIGLAIGGPAVTAVLAYVAAGAIVAVLAAIWTVFCACLYRRLAGSMSGI